MNEETKTLLTITRHIALVRRAIRKISDELEHRSEVHDLSKLNDDEFGGFVKINQIAREHPYGSEEYKASLNSIAPSPVQLHYVRNRHHPEYHPNGVNDMNLIDLIEMVCDWYGASQTYGQTSFKDSLEISIIRFGLSPQQEHTVRLIADFIQD